MNSADPVDRAFVASIMPADGIPVSLISIVSWLDEDGESHWKLYLQCEESISSVLGLLELAKIELVRRSSPRMYQEDEDDDG